MAAIRRNTLAEVDGLQAPLNIHLAEEDEFISMQAAGSEIIGSLARKAKRDCPQLSWPASPIALTVHWGTTMQQLRRLPISEPANFEHQQLQ